MTEKREIENLLQLWGAWAAGSIGTQIKPLMMWQAADPQKVRPSMSDEEAETFDPAVASLRLVDKELFDVIRLHYVYRLSFEAIARVKNTNKKECFYRCMRAKCFIEGFLNGYAAAGEKIMAIYGAQI